MPRMTAISKEATVANGPRTDQRIRQFWARIEPGERFDDLVPEEMEWPRVVILVEHPDGPYLYRCAAQCEFAGDTWHQTHEQPQNHDG
jgi:hypothetical protein